MYTLENNTKKRVSKGMFYPMGASLSPDGVNFAIYSEYALQVYLLLFDKPSGMPTDIICMEEKTKNIWHCFVHGLKTGQLYGYKITGEYDPDSGLRFNPNKLLIDPYAKAFTHKFNNKENLLLAYNPNSIKKDLEFDARDDTEIVPKCIVVDDAFDWHGDELLEIPFDKLIIYETHVKGFTAHPSSGVKYPGTYLSFAEKIPYLKSLGINAVEFLPIQEFYVEDFLFDKKLTNYWGYNTSGFFAPEICYGTQKTPGCQVQEFKTMVRELHKAGIEIILDVVYNHTAEGNELGPTISFRGIDNPTYYYLTGETAAPKRHYINITGCGNTVNLTNPPVIRLVMDSLRYWAEVMHIDGFRFDLASVLGREAGMFQKSASFFDAISQDPVLSHVKLIAEPWDMSTYQAGNFPIDWAEWNGKFRDSARKFIRGDRGIAGDLARRITGSADLYGDSGRSAYNSINFITCHDGFTINDLVSYKVKHNEANLDGNRDGSNDNNSLNCGVEGETADQDVIKLRHKLIKNYISLLCFSLGTPMFMAGDEFLRTQKGNNNAYCQDNNISWVDWKLSEINCGMIEFFKKAVSFRKNHTIMQRKKFFTGLDNNCNNKPDCAWYDWDLKTPDWNNQELRFLSYELDGSEEKSDLGEYFIYLAINSDDKPVTSRLPGLMKGMKWHKILDTSLPFGEDFIEDGKEKPLDNQNEFLSVPKSVCLFIGK
jgi:glycogen operon protein